METHHFIALKDGTPRDWMQASAALVQSAGMNQMEAAKACRRGFGLILHPLSKAQADAGAAALTQNGFAARSLAPEQLVQAPSSVSALSFSIENGVLHCPLVSGASVDLPLASIRIFYVCNLIPGKQRSEREILAEMDLVQGSQARMKNVSDVKASLAVGAVLLGNPMIVAAGAQQLVNNLDPRNTPASTAKAPEKPEPSIDLVCLAPLIRVRFRQRKFNYQTLGPRLLPNMRGNFKTIVKDLLAALPGAVQLGQVKEAASGGDIEQERLAREDADVTSEMSAVLTRAAVFAA